MSTTPESGAARRRPVIAFMAYGVVLVLLGWAGVALWASGSREQRDLAGSRRAIPVGATATPVETVRHDRTQEAPASPAPAAQEPQQAAAAVSPAPQSEAPVATPQKPEPATAKCTLDPASWPADQTEQAKAIQILLRDQGFYAGTTYGTLGPATRAAIRKFQLAAGQAETGEPSEMLFESLKKKCAP